MSKFWDFFDKIYCINLITRDDRYKKTKKLFKKLNISVKYFRPEKHPTSGAQGCYESHLSIIQEAYNNNYEHIFIFEDDIMANERYSEKLLDKAYEFISTNQDWDIFYLGHSPDIIFNNSRTLSKYIVNVYSCQTHAYAISRRFMKIMLNKHKKFIGMNIDILYRNINNCYALFPMVFEQDIYDQNDISTSMHHNPAIIRFCEHFSYTVNYSVINIVLFIILGVFVVLLFYYLCYLLF